MTSVKPYHKAYRTRHIPYYHIRHALQGVWLIGTRHVLQGVWLIGTRHTLKAYGLSGQGMPYRIVAQLGTLSHTPGCSSYSAVLLSSHEPAAHTLAPTHLCGVGKDRAPFATISLKLVLDDASRSCTQGQDRLPRRSQVDKSSRAL